MSVEPDLVEKLKRIETLFARAGTAGERVAAGTAIDRIKRRIDAWSRRLFIALLRRYDIEPYRRYRQRHTTVMARVSKAFVDQTLWSEFTALDEALQEHLDAITNNIISEAIFADVTEIKEVAAIEG